MWLIFDSLRNSFADIIAHDLSDKPVILVEKETFASWIICCSEKLVNFFLG